MTFSVLQKEGRESVWLVRIDLCLLLLFLLSCLTYAVQLVRVATLSALRLRFPHSPLGWIRGARSVGSGHELQEAQQEPVHSEATFC